MDRIRQRMLVVAASLSVSVAFAQSSSLLEPNNSAGTPLDTQPTLTRPDTTSTEAPSRTSSSLWAFDTLDKERRGYVTPGDVAGLPGTFNFSQADRNRDGRLDEGEFQRFWDDYQSGSE